MSRNEESMVALARRIQGLEATVATLTKSGEDQSARFQGAPPPPCSFATPLPTQFLGATWIMPPFLLSSSGCQPGNRDD